MKPFEKRIHTEETVIRALKRKGITVTQEHELKDHKGKIIQLPFTVNLKNAVEGEVGNKTLGKIDYLVSQGFGVQTA